MKGITMNMAKRNEEYLGGEKLNGLFFFGNIIEDGLYLLKSNVVVSSPSMDSFRKNVVRRSHWHVIRSKNSEEYFFAMDEYDCFDRSDFEELS